MNCKTKNEREYCRRLVKVFLIPAHYYIDERMDQNKNPALIEKKVVNLSVSAGK